MGSQKVRIVTWNILHGMDYRTGAVDLDQVCSSLRALAPDVVALQEVDRHLERSGNVDQTAAVATELGLRGVFSPSLVGSPDASWEPAGAGDDGGPGYGISLLSRFDIAALRRVRLPGGGTGQRSPKATPTRPGWDQEPRWALQAQLRAQRPLTVTCTHLSYMPWRGTRQLRWVLAAAGGDREAILLGDLNLPRPVVRALSPRWTYAGGDKTHPADAPRLQLDHVLARGVRVLSTTIGAPAASDHLPVIVDVEIPG